MEGVSNYVFMDPLVFEIIPSALKLIDGFCKVVKEFHEKSIGRRKAVTLLALI